MIRKTIFMVLALVMFATVASAADRTVVVTWNPNTEPDMKEYTGFQYSSSTDTTVDATWVVSHPTVTKSLVVSVPDNGTATICVELNAVDLSNNASARCPRVCATLTGADTVAPATPTNLRITVTPLP